MKGAELISKIIFDLLSVLFGCKMLVSRRVIAR